MTHVWEWLLDLESIRLEPGAPLSLRWQSLWPAWVVMMAIVVVVVGTWLIYRREGGAPWGRVVGGTLRLCLLLAVLGLIAQPVLLLQRTRVEPSHIALLIDSSASMAATDRYAPSGDVGATQPASTSASTAGSSVRPNAEGQRRSRAELLIAALEANAGANLTALAERNDLVLYAFSDRARLQAGPLSSDDLGVVETWLSSFQPKGTQTDPAGAIDQVLSEARTARLAAVVVASDGRSTVGGDVENAVRTATEMHIPIHTIMLGSSTKRRDVTVGPARADETVFVDDVIAVQVQVAANGYDDTVPLRVQLVDPDGGVLADRRVDVKPDAGPVEIELNYRPSQPGRLRMRARVEPLSGESNTNNNAVPVEVRVVDTKIRALYVEGYPRYEYRYLKNMLIREATIVASCLLLSADEGFTQEGNEPVKRFPATMEELRPFDVVIFGDVDPRGDWLSPRQTDTLLEWVGKRGGGFMMIAGPRWSPQAYLGTPLEKLIPVRIEPQVASLGDDQLTTPFQLQLTFEGRRSSVFRFEPDPNENAETLAALPGMYWYAQTRGAMPGVEVLAEHPTVRSVDGAMPLLVVGRYGAGSRAFAGIEGTWRWRRDVGRRLFDAYWLQVIRHLTRRQFLGRDRGFVLQADRPHYDLGQPIVLTLSVLDKSEAAAMPAEVLAEVVDAEDRVVHRVRLSRLGTDAQTYEGTFTPSRAGSFVVRVPASTGRPEQKPPTAMIHVAAAGPELRRLTPDHDLLKTLARRTGGVAVGPDGIGQIAERIDDRSVQIPDDVAEPLWDTKLVLALFVLIIGVEWIVRKASGLV